MPGRGHRRSRVCTYCPVIQIHHRRQNCTFCDLTSNGYVNSCNLGLWTRAQQGVICNYDNKAYLEKVLATLEDNEGRAILLRYLSSLDKQAKVGALQVVAQEG